MAHLCQKIHSYLGLPPVCSGGTVVRKTYFKIRVKIVQKFPRIAFYFKSQKVVETNFMFACKSELLNPIIPWFYVT